MLSVRSIDVQGEGFAPTGAAVGRHRQHGVIAEALFLVNQPVSRQDIAPDGRDRGKVGPIDEPVGPGSHGARSRPRIPCARRQPKRVAVSGGFKPAQHHGAILAQIEMRLRTPLRGGHRHLPRRLRVRRRVGATGERTAQEPSQDREPIRATCHWNPPGSARVAPPYS